MHGFVSTEGILSKIRAKMQAKERGDSTPTRHDFLFSKADRACMAGQLRQAHGRDGVRACRQSLPRLSPAHSDEDAIPWVLEEQDPYGKLPMRRCGHSVRFLFSGNNAADAWADTCAILPSPSSPPSHARSRRRSLPDTRIPETRSRAHARVRVYIHRHALWARSTSLSLEDATTGRGLSTTSTSWTVRTSMTNLRSETKPTSLGLPGAPR